MAFTPPGTADLSADAFGSPSGGGEEGDFVSSGITAKAQTSGSERYGENVNFYQLEDTVSTTRRMRRVKNSLQWTVAFRDGEKRCTYLAFPMKRLSIIGQPARMSVDLLSIGQRHTSDVGVVAIKAVFNSAT